MHLSEIVRRQAVARPGDPSYSCAETELTWRQTDERTSRLAAALYARGLRHGDRVAILAKACHRYWEVHFGCAKAGLVVVPVNHRLQAAEVEHILRDVGAKAAVVDARLVGVIASAAIPLRVGFGRDHGQPLDYEQTLAEHDPVPPPVTIDDNDLNVIASTSRDDRRGKGRHAHASRSGTFRLRIRNGQPVPRRRRGVDLYAALRLARPIRRPVTVIARCRAELAHFKAPQSVRFPAALPRNAMGKLDKRAIRASCWSGRGRHIAG